MNISTILYNYTYNAPNSWDSFIISECNDWRNYSTYSHIFYMYLFFIYLLLNLIKPYFNPEIYFKINDKFYFKENLIDYLQWITLGVLFLRIFQIYWISVLYLGGL
jgi:hypothetical protein